jgi:hypothetical protein
LCRLPPDLIKDAPRLTFLSRDDDGVEELFDKDAHAAGLAGLGEGVIFRCTRSRSDTWVMQHASKIIEAAKTNTSYLSALIDRLSIHRFKPGDLRNLAPIFSSLSGQSVRMTIEDPWCGARQHGRESLSKFLDQIQKLGIDIEALQIIWKSDNTDEPESFQESSLRDEIGRQYTGSVDFIPKRRHDVRHFHDRVIYFDILETGERMRVDVSSGIDNLMSRTKECSLFVERS